MVAECGVRSRLLPRCLGRIWVRRTPSTISYAGDDRTGPSAPSSCSSRRSGTSPTRRTCSRCSRTTHQFHRGLPAGRRFTGRRRSPDSGLVELDRPSRDPSTTFTPPTVPVRSHVWRSMPCSCIRRCRRFCSGVGCAGSPRWCRSTRHRSSTTSWASSTPTRSAHPHVERFKYWANRRCYARARHLITWSEWAKRGLVDQYGVSADDVTVIAPGVDVDRWSVPDRIRSRRTRAGALRRRRSEAKGWRPSARGVAPTARRRRGPRVRGPSGDLAARDVDEPGVVVHTGLTANSPELIEQYHLADIFCLPDVG